MTTYTVKDFSKMLYVHEHTVTKYLRDGKLKGRKVAHKWVVTEEDLKEFMSMQKEAEELEIREQTYRRQRE